MFRCGPAIRIQVGTLQKAHNGITIPQTYVDTPNRPRFVRVLVNGTLLMGEVH